MRSLGRLSSGARSLLLRSPLFSLYFGGMGTEIPTENWGIEDGANQYQNGAAADSDSDSFHQNGKLNSSHSAPKTRLFPFPVALAYTLITSERIGLCACDDVDSLKRML